MKKIIMLTLWVSLTLNSGSLFAGDGATEEPRPGGQALSPATSSLSPPAFSLEDFPQDSPGLTKKKAALRLFKAYGVTMGQLAACRGQVPETAKAVEGFSSRNGNTLATALGVIKQQGGLTPEAKNIMNAAIAEEVSKAGDCGPLVKAVADGERDIYKAPQYQEDYKLIRSK